MLSSRQMTGPERREIEQKWQQRWQDDRIFAVDLAKADHKFYHLNMFPYPSGNLHVGHWYNFAVSDIAARAVRRQDKTVFNPMGFDAFGLPAENAAIKHGLDPAAWTEQNISSMRTQLQSTGASFDWSKEIATCRPDYYRWTQWMFLFMYQHGLTEKREAPVNWCPKDQTILANEQVVGGKCERCGSEVILKKLPQWVFKITDYAERLLKDVDALDWPEKTKTMQRNWIGRSEGAYVEFSLADTPDTRLKVFTTRVDTLYGVTYLVVAPEHSLTPKLTAEGHTEAVEAYVESASHKSELERTELQKQKTGVFSGSYAIHPLTAEKLPIWIADYVLATVGTGAVMGVPAHDERDWEFAKKHDLLIVAVIHPATGEVNANQVVTEPGKLINSAEFSGQTSEEAKQTIVAKLKELGLGQPAVTYRLRDWVVSRQRYWGAPIPIVYCGTCDTVPVPAAELPVLLPTDVDFKPTGESPLARSESFSHTTCPRCGNAARRETDTLDTFVDSSWYFFRFLSPDNTAAFTDQALAKKWLPVDLYIGGAEHSVLHLLYARFFTKVLYDHDLSPVSEPFQKLRHQGTILGPDNQKMSKSKGNVVDPDALVAEHGADVVRSYLAFMGPYNQGGPWHQGGLVGVERFFNRVERLVIESAAASSEVGDSAGRERHSVIKKVTEEIAELRFNTALAALMAWANNLEKRGASREDQEALTSLLNPFAPHLTEELWQHLGHEPYLALAAWPEFDNSLTVEDRVIVVVQINGRLRGSFETQRQQSEAALIRQARQIEAIQHYLTGEPKKTIVVPDKLINFVI